MTVIDQRHDVLVVTHYFPPHIGGIERVASAEAHGLARMGSSVRVLTSGRAAPATDQGTGVDVTRVPALNVLERFGVPFPLFSPLALLLRGLKQVRRAAVVHVHDTLYLSSWVAALWCRLLTRPLVVTQHVAVVAHPWRVVALVQRLVYRTLGRSIWNSASTVFYLNSGVRDSLLDFGVDESRLSPLVNGVDLEAFRPAGSPREREELRGKLGLPADRPLVLLVGRLVPKKGYHRLVEAARDQDRWTAVLVGEGEHVTESDQVVVVGALSPPQLNEVYRACDVFVLPSQAEGFPLTVQEAMASGLPVITSDDPGYDMYGLNRDLISLVPIDDSSLSPAIDAILDDDRKRASMAAYSREFAEREFSWQAHVDRLLTTYSDVRKAQPAPGLVRNSAFLIIATVLTAALGLAFWSAAARLYDVSDIGRATSLISAISLLSYLGLFGLNGSLIRFIPGSRRPDRQVSAALTLTALASAALAAGYLGLLPLIAPKAHSVAHGIGFALLFIGVTAGAAVNLAADSVFIAYRAAHWNPVVDGLLQGLGKLLPLLFLAAAGTIGLVASFGLGSLVAAVASIALIVSRLGLRLRPTLKRAALRGYFSYSAASYVSSLFNLAPYLILPLVALDRLGTTSAGYYYVAFQIAALLNAVPFAIGESLFAESSHAPGEVKRLARSSARLITITLIPAALAVCGAAPLILRIFGAGYVGHATVLLRLLALGSLAVAANSWTSFLLKIQGSLGAMVVSNLIYCATAAGLALALTPLGLTGLAIAWAAANVVSAVVALPVLRDFVTLPDFAGFSGTYRRLRCASFK